MPLRTKSERTRNVTNRWGLCALEIAVDSAARDGHLISLASGRLLGKKLVDRSPRGCKLRELHGAVIDHCFHHPSPNLNQGVPSLRPVYWLDHVVAPKHAHSINWGLPLG